MDNKFTYISHQFSLFDYNEMRERLPPIPIRRISKARMEQAMREMRQGKGRKMVDILRSLNDSLDNYERRLTNKPNNDTRNSLPSPGR